MNQVKAEPRASALIESMRDLGYSLETALADILDNSIAAGATTIDVLFEAGDGTPLICVIDNGCAMSSEELLEAMRPGSRNPLEERAPNDLGRFGLGLKTASFSQCRKLTVVSRRGGRTSAAKWDLDLVAKHDEWLLQIPGDGEIRQLPWVDRLPEVGTMVLWENLDRLTDRTSGAKLKDHLYERINSANDHIGLVFHRYLQGEAPFRKVGIAINGNPVDPYDPFNPRHPATQLLPQEVMQLEGQRITIQPFILPHHKKIGRAEYDRYAGEGGYLKNQGFYIYRNGRLIIHGTWFRLAKQSELTKLARVRIDMPAGLDQLWKIDVRKASAQPPFLVRYRLKRIIEQITGASGRVYVSKGRRILDSEVASLWVRRVDKNEIFYEINRDHPVLEHFDALLDNVQREKFYSVLKVIERCFPTDAFFADSAGNPEALRRDDLPVDVLGQLVRMTLDIYLAQRMEKEEIVRAFERTEPFRSHQDLTRRILVEEGIATNEL